MGRGRCLVWGEKLVDWEFNGRRVGKWWEGGVVPHTGKRFVGCGDEWHFFFFGFFCCW